MFANFDIIGCLIDIYSFIESSKLPEIFTGTF